MMGANALCCTASTSHTIKSILNKIHSILTCCYTALCINPFFEMIHEYKFYAYSAKQTLIFQVQLGSLFIFDACSFIFLLERVCVV